MNRIKGRDWLIMLLDIVAVNGSYFLALFLRFYMSGQLLYTVPQYPQWALETVPFYTVVCLVVFWLFRLYGGMWQYAGINDMNRILAASVITSAFMVAGTLIAGHRMPFSYYVVGAFFQFVFITFIRFTSRLWAVERRKFKNWRKTGQHVMVVGAGSAASRMIRNLEDSKDLQPVCVLDSKARVNGRSMDGIPVYGGTEMLEYAVTRNDVKVIYIADPLLQPEMKSAIEKLCRAKGLDLQDYGSAIYLSGSEDLAESQEILSDKQLKKQIPFSPPDISEREIGEVVDAMRSGWITTGPRTKLLERRLAAFIETGDVDADAEAETDQWKEKVVCLNSATAAEELNLRILGIREGDEVIVPAYTYTASASAVIHCGATVRFVDIQKNGDSRTGMPEMDYEALEAAITPRTKAIIVVDLGGIVADYDWIFEIVNRKKNLFAPLEPDGTPLGDLSAKIQKGLGRVAVLADCAHGLGARRKVTHSGNGAAGTLYCGRIAHFTSFSFHAVKNFTTAEGGASTWCLPKSVYDLGVTDHEIYRIYQLLSLHGQSKDALAKSKVGAWEYDIVGPWYKCNMTDIMAAIGLRQLDRYPGLLERRSEMIRKYDAVCDELGLWHLHHHVEGMDSSNHLYLVRIPGGDEDIRNKVIEEMAKDGVSTNVHYKPLPMMTAYKQLGWDIKDFPNTYDYYRNLFTLPLHTLLSDDDVETVCSALRKVTAELGIQAGKSGANWRRNGRLIW